MSQPSPNPDEALTAAQQRAVAHRGGGLRILGGAGTGKTRTLVARFAALVNAGVAPESILVLTLTPGGADELRTQLEQALGDRPFEELAVHTVPDLAARVLHEESLTAGLDPFALPASPADRLALLLERMDELPLRHHDLGGTPANVLARIVARIDACKDELLDHQDVAAWAAALPDDDPHAEREREFAALYAAHDRMLGENGGLDFGDLVLRAHRLLAERPDVRERVAARRPHVLVDEYQDLTPAHVALIDLLSRAPATLVAAGDDDQAVRLTGRGTGRTLAALTERRPELETIVLDRVFRGRDRVLRAAAAVVEPIPGRVSKPLVGEEGGNVRFWRCANERAQAQSVAVDIERLVRGGTPPEKIAVIVRSVRREGQAVAVALDERAVAYRLVGAAAFFQRAEVRDVLAWLRLLADPGDAGAVVRALARPPIELRAIDLARCVQIARRRKVDMVGALVAATESPQIPPEARDRIVAFLKLYRGAAAALDTSRPDLFVHRLIDRLGLRRQQLYAAQADVVERLVQLARLGEMAAAYTRRAPQATPREFARYLAAVADAGAPGLFDDEDRAAAAEHTAGGGGARTGAIAIIAMHAAKGLEVDHVFVLGLQSSRMPGARRTVVEPTPVVVADGDSQAEHVAAMRRLLHVAMTRARSGLVLAYAATSDRGARQPPSPFAEDARAALGAGWEDREEELFGPDEALHATFQTLRDELLRNVPKVGGVLGEMRLDTDLDIAHGTVRYLELVKLAALMDRPAGLSIADALPDINARVLQAATAQQRDVFLTSPLDDVILNAERDVRARAAAVAAREEPTLEPFLPTRGDGLVLSASDIETYRSCPLKYKFARVFRIPQEPTMNQRFGILVHQALERYHGAGTSSLDELLGLFELGWRRGGFGDTDQERQLRIKATNALHRYHERFLAEQTEPVWFERSFQFKMGPHVLRGRVDRVDRKPDGSHELIDYKTGRPRTLAQLREDVQLSLYAVGAREAWELDSSSQAYHYVLDDEKITVPPEALDPEWITQTVFEVAEGILGQGFEPTPSYAACSMCDFRIACPAAER